MSQQLATGQAARKTLPSRALTDPRFKWIDSAKTDITRTWRKHRLLQRLQAKEAA